MKRIIILLVAMIATLGAAGQKVGEITIGPDVDVNVYFLGARLNPSTGKYTTYKWSMPQLRAYIGDGSGSPVSHVSSGNLNPLFTVAVTTPSTTPTFVYSLTPAAAYSILGNNTGSSAAPTYFVPALASALYRNQGQTNYVLHGHASGNPSWGVVNLTNEVGGVLASPYGGTDNSSYTVGDFLYASGTTTLSKRGIGASGEVLTVSGGLPVWAAIPAASVTPTNTVTFTNKRWVPRVDSLTSSATPTINSDNVDIVKIKAQAANITSMTTNMSGSPNHGDLLRIEFTATGAYTVVWGAKFGNGSVALPTAINTTTVVVVLQYFTTSSWGNNLWICVRVF